MGQSNIPVSIDAKGNLVCPDITGQLSESITWVPDGTTVASIQSITPSVGSFNPAPSSTNNWTGTIASAGRMPNSQNGVEYTIVANPVNSTSGQKTRTPKIAIPPTRDDVLQVADALQETKV